MTEKETMRKWKLERGNVGYDHPLFITAEGRDGVRFWTDADTLEAFTALSSHQALVDALKHLLSGIEECEDTCTPETCCWAQADAALKLAEGGPDAQP